MIADLITKTLRSNDGYLIADTLVGLEVEGEFGVVAFDNDLGRFLDGLRANSTLQYTLACKNRDWLVMMSLSALHTILALGGY